MRGRFFFLVISISGIVACPSGRDGASDSAHLVIERASPHPAHLLNAAAHARYCSRDSSLTIVAVGTDWSAVVGMRSAWPPTGAFTADSALAGIGTAAVALRSGADSVAPALVSRSGKVEIDSGAALKGRFTVQTGPDSISVILTGHFEATRRDSAGCPAP